MDRAKSIEIRKLSYLKVAAKIANDIVSNVNYYDS